MMGAAYPHDIPVLILDNHDWKYPPLQALARRHGTIDVLFEYLTDVDDQNVSKEALDMYDFFGRERERRNKA